MESMRALSRRSSDVQLVSLLVNQLVDAVLVNRTDRGDGRGEWGRCGPDVDVGL